MKKWNLAQCCLALTGDLEMKTNAVFDHEKLVIGKMKTFIVNVIAICGLEIEFLAFKSQCRSMTQLTNAPHRRCARFHNHCGQAQVKGSKNPLKRELQSFSSAAHTRMTN